MVGDLFPGRPDSINPRSTRVQPGGPGALLERVGQGAWQAGEQLEMAMSKIGKLYLRKTALNGARPRFLTVEVKPAEAMD